MKTKIILSLLLSLSFYLLSSQVPQGFNYQAVAHTSTGAPVANTNLQVKAAILSDTLTPVVVWEELHSTVKTNTSGVFSLIIGTGTRQSGSALTFNEVDWTKSLFIKMQLYYQNSWKSLGSAKLWTVPYAMVAEKLTGSVKKLAVTGETSDMEEALFEVKNKEGQTVFAVYNEGVRIYVDDGAKGAKGGFAIGGFGTNKSQSQNLFVVNPDSIRAYIDNGSGKGVKGGFAIGGFGTSKEPGVEYLRVTHDSTRIYLNDTISKAVKGGFAIGGFGKAKGSESEYMIVEPNNTKFYVRTLANETSSTFNIIGIDQNQTEASLLMANKDTIEVSGVLNLQNNLIVNGDINVAGTVSQDSIVKDADGNIYNTVIIGTKIWMKENLKTTKYNDGATIPLVTNGTTWRILTTPGYCWYNNNQAAYKNTYGALYNWYTVNTGKLCAAGWHVPTDAEWTSLETYLGGESVAGGKLKETGTIHWLSPNAGATNETGFTGVPGGYRNTNDGYFYLMGWANFFWSSSVYDISNALKRYLVVESGEIRKSEDLMTAGLSVRCIKD
ncbi:MAG: fibrobacter succinogenes major paralogous domain-containing protein [Bacteroidia bacterium]|nr:fibrobacter succinogenes major paralogous domain-containing protein [Bacteroidia bacterium]